LNVKAASADPGSGELDATQFIMNKWRQVSLYYGYFHSETTVVKEDGDIDVTLESFDASAFAFYLRFFHIFEFLEVNGVEGFQDDGVDVPLPYFYNLGCRCLEWAPNEWEVYNFTVGGDEYFLYMFEIKTADDVFTMRFTATSYPIEIEGVKITPDSIKVDLEIKYYDNPKNQHIPCLFDFCTTGPSPANLFPNAQLGVSAILAAAGGSASYDNNGEGEPSLQFASSSVAAKGFLRWVTDANITVGGVVARKRVFASVNATLNGDMIAANVSAAGVVRVGYFSFEGARPSDIAWDPEFGAEIDYDSAPNGNALVIGLSVGGACLLVILVIAIVIFVVRKNRRGYSSIEQK